MTNEPTTTDAQPNGQSPSTGHQSPEQRAETNRENARKSTGPRTEAGKQRSSLNALRHGLTGHTVVLPSDDLAAYQRHCKGFHDQYQPKNPTEVQLTQTVADLSWRLNRATAIETNMLALGITEKSNSVDTENDQVHTSLAMAKAFREQRPIRTSPHRPFRQGAQTATRDAGAAPKAGTLGHAGSRPAPQDA